MQYPIPRDPLEKDAEDKRALGILESERVCKWWPGNGREGCRGIQGAATVIED